MENVYILKLKEANQNIFLFLNPGDSGESEQTADEESVEDNSDREEDELDEESVEDELDEEAEGVSDKEFEEQCRHYRRQLIETKGFFETSDKLPPCVYYGVGSLGYLDEPAMLGLTTREVCEKLTTSLCLQRYNEEEPYFELCYRCVWLLVRKKKTQIELKGESRVYSILEMAPKSSDGESNYGSSSAGDTKDGSSSKTQSTESMEISTGDESSMLGKRKVETTNLEDLNENEGDVEGVDEEENSESDSDSEWDKDSFDGLEYRSSDDQKEYIDKDLEKRARFYKRTVIETKGFFEATDEFPPYLWAGIATVPGLDDDLEEGLTVRQFLANMTSLCLDKYNKRKGFNVKLEHVLRANFNPGGRTTYYITFAARESDSPDAPLVEYQAKVDWSAGKTYPILCRPTSPPKLVEGSRGDQLKEVAEDIN
ncbi:uncharacterized protein LOC9318483 [Arabidopsis lyrata subsp. lyrata]|uniref:uncharacterized protein LOC9318483 n=1 Tax=Arabidopsis lyrata subsp. lyrata TaxID=81972 RepID=UPI000A29A590|nr:uncharacterized protein LOC9318483 [Arabidopsis lyrata subsp. lyrata]|eukprot:XP_020886545.1 uncharacterized protein LOC9318483 [Arabidopsis lyrata subsp. lyrata]